MRERVIFHVDVNSAFLSWEACHRIRNLNEAIDLREIPSIIGGDREKRRGVVLAKSVIAKKYGVQTGEPIIQALSKCPDLVIVSPNYELYVKYSKEFITLLREYTPCVEQCSIDEAFMDMTGTEGLYGEPIKVAHQLRERIYHELGFTVNIGISSNKLLAKMASDFKKPNLVHTLLPEEIKDKMWPMPVGELFFVGRVAEKKLKLLGIKTIGQLAQADVQLLREHLNKQGEAIYEYAHGRDSRRVQQEDAALKGYGNSMTTPFDVNSSEEARLVLLSLCETVGARLRADGIKASCISVSLVDIYFEHHSHQVTLSSATYTTNEIYEEACKIFEKLWDHKIPIRQLGVHTCKLSDSKVYQYSMFQNNKFDKYVKRDQALDCIRNKFGEDAVMRASFIGKNLEHMAGGLSKERGKLDKK